MSKQHTIPGLPDIYSIKERPAGQQPRFTPQLNGRVFTRPNGSVAWFTTLEEAESSVIQFVAMMADAAAHE